MAKKKTEHYYGLKEFADFAFEEGVIKAKVPTRALSVYKERGQLPEPVVMIGDRAGWTKEQIDKWIQERKNQNK